MSLAGKKVLIANRGEIAVRIIKTCKKLGIKTVAVYSDSDAEAMHVRLADEKFHLGPSNPLKSYLNIDRLSEAIVSTKSDAVHPGYGFLAENAEFARAVDNLGVIWIGPPASVLENLTSKTYSRQMAVKAGVPIIPGSLNAVTYEEAVKIAEELNTPVLIKPDRGGGGKGTRKINNPSELTRDVFDAAAREALYGFGKPDLYVEKLLTKPRHIEVQIVADYDGNVVALGERECSVQRRYQKVVEEAPSPVVDESLRRRLYEMAKNYAKTIGYVNAGTVEFLVDSSGDIYFLEMNKRIQVEHPVTEETTGLDIVELQLKIAFNKHLDVQNDLTPRGHAIEARVYAEDPKTFMPSPGKITKAIIPEENNIRVDHALEDGFVVSPFYDPLIAKVVAKGSSRIDCIVKLSDYLDNKIRIEGIKTNIPLLSNILRHEDFVKGNVYTSWLDEMLHL